MKTYRIEVAISYSSAQEEYVTKCATNIQQMGLNFWYYPFEKAKIVGEDLTEYLTRVYKEWARMCVMFISKEYVASAWARLERKAALSRQLMEDSVYIIPIRFDNTEVPGLDPEIAYLRRIDYTEEELAKVIRDRYYALKP
jgi:hypothetical protein